MRSYSTGSLKTQRLSLHDTWFIAIVAGIVMLGLLMMTSASIVLSDKQLHQPFYFLYKQSILLMAGIVIGSVVMQIEMIVWQKLSTYLLLGVMLMLALVLVPGIGRSVNGSARWLGVGPLSFQVSELTKFAVVLYLAGYLIRRHDEVQYQLSGFMKPMLILAAIAVLLLREPDFGAAVVVISTALGMMFLGGMRLRNFVILFSIVMSALAVIAISAPYRLLRLTSFLNPWERPFDTGYQLTQSLIAFGRGGWFGVGLGKSIQKMFYLPEAHTDFLFAVIAEELGLVGVLFVILLFLALVVRIFMIGRKAFLLDRPFAGLIAFGFGLWIAIQFTVSVGVNSGLLPTKGLTLPLMSYGGSSILVNCLVIAILLRIDHENRLAMLGVK